MAEGAGGSEADSPDQVAGIDGSWAFSAQYFIVSGLPGCGKTSFLQRSATRFHEKGLKVKGILAPHGPDGAGDGRRSLRLLKLLSSSEVLPFQLDCAPGPEGCADWIFIDEIGPLELRRKEGLEPALGDLLRAARAGELGPPQSRFMIVVRPSLRDQVVETYLQLDPPGGDSPGSGFFTLAPEAQAAAAAAMVVDVDPGEDPDALIERLAQLPPLF
ncbi:unnamed protein product [Durusdinium trenchii]|uniref:NTPase n=1 Tax=Durusdinium trenchii TaxID=1381693 RepID=A0ABP0SBY0_9DINO